jgi:integrase
MAPASAFDRAAGEPLSWAPAPGDVSVATWAQRWIAQQWEEWQPRTRTSAIEALTRFIPLVVSEGADDPPEGIRAHLATVLGPRDGWSDDACAKWLARWSRPLSELTRANLAPVDQQLGRGLSGQQLAPGTAGRYRKIARACIRRAVDLEIIPTDPWPPPARGRGQRKNSRKQAAFDERRLPNPETMRRAIDAIRTHQPSSRTYQVMTAVAYYAGLRPSEVVMLRTSHLTLPEDGWGRIDVLEADIAFNVSGEPTTGPRSVPIPPVLVAMLTEWVGSLDTTASDRLFLTRSGNQPTPSNWTRAWHRALRSIDHPTLRIYDCRHAAATTWLQAGVPLGEAARRLGHSVETLVSTYVGSLTGDEEISNSRIETHLSSR